jgi:hypothetical protein
MGTTTLEYTRPSNTVGVREQQLRRLVNEYVQYFNTERPHQGIDQRIPAGPDTSQPVEGEIVARPVLGGLHHAYSRRAA